MHPKKHAYPWHPWFAWHPVLTPDGGWVWLHHVARRAIHSGVPGERPQWEYRALDSEGFRWYW